MMRSTPDFLGNLTDSRACHHVSRKHSQRVSRHAKELSVLPAARTPKELAVVLMKSCIGLPSMGDPTQRSVASWVLQQRAGSGSFAVVWKAVHRETGKVVAIKEISTDRLNKKLKQSLESEVSILKQIRHRNIVYLEDVVEVLLRNKTLELLDLAGPCLAKSPAGLGSAVCIWRFTGVQLPVLDHGVLCRR